MGDFLSHISNTPPEGRSNASRNRMDTILKMFDDLEVTVRQSEAADKRIEARRAS